MGAVLAAPLCRSLSCESSRQQFPSPAPAVFGTATLSFAVVATTKRALAWVQRTCFIPRAFVEGWLSGLRHLTRNQAWVNNPPGVQIPPLPPSQ